MPRLRFILAGFVRIRRIASLVLLTASCVAGLRAQTWRVDPAFAPQLTDESYATTTVRLLPLGDGRLVVHGNFGFINEAPVANGFARLRADGGIDTLLAPAPAALLDTQALVRLADGRFLGVGRFRVGPSVRTQLFRLLADGTTDPTFAPLEIGAMIAARLFALPTGGTLIAGAFASIGGVPRQRLARLTPDGAVDLSFVPDLGSQPAALTAVAPLADGRMLVAANVVVSPPNSAPRLWRLHADGSRDAGFAPAPLLRDVTIIAAQSDGRVIVSGYAPPLVRLNADGLRDETFAVDLEPDGSARRVAVLANGRLAVETSSGNVYMLEATGARRTDVCALLGGECRVSLVAIDGDSAFVSHSPALGAIVMHAVEPTVSGALLNTPFPLPRSIVQRLLGDGTLDPVFRLRFASAGTVSQLALDSVGRVLIAGAFDRVNGVERPGLARLLPGGELDPSFAPESTSRLAAAALLVAPDDRVLVRSIASFGQPVVIGGITVPPTPISEWQRLRVDGSRDPTFAPADSDANGEIFGFDIDGSMIAGSFVFSSTGSRPDYRLHRLNSDGTRRATLPTVFSEVNRVSVFGLPPSVDEVQPIAGGRLLIAGGFARVNGIARAGLVRLEPDGSVDASYDLPDVLSSSRFAHLLQNSRALFHYFEPLAGDALGPIGSGNWRTLRLAANGTPDTSFAAPRQRHPESPLLAEQPDGALVFRGARLRADGSRDLNFAPDLDGHSLSRAAALTDGSVLIAGTFRSVNGEPRTGLARFVPVEMPGITVPPRSQTVMAGRPATFEIATGSSAAVYQWTHDGVPLAGATTATLTIESAGRSDAGLYRAVATVAGQTYTSAPAELVVAANTARLANFSARSRVDAARPQIVGFVMVPGIAPRRVLLRAVGIGLPVNIGALLPDPLLALHDHSEQIAADRGSAIMAEMRELARSVGAFPLAAFPYVPNWNYGAALAPTIAGGTFSARTTSADGRAGLSLFECYDTGDEDVPPLVRNASVRGHTGPGALVLTAGFVVRGNGPLRVLMRGLGPALAAFGVEGALNDPRLAIYPAGWLDPQNGNLAPAGNDDWSSLSRDAIADAARAAGAFALPTGSRDAAVLLTLEPGAYTAQLSTSTAGDEGEGMIEIYVLDPK